MCHLCTLLLASKPCLHTQSTRWRCVTGTCTPVVRSNHDNTIMSSDDLGPDFNACYLSRASKAAQLVAATCRIPTEPRRDPTAQFWRPRLVPATKQQTKRDEKTDSKLFDSALHVVTTTETSHHARYIAVICSTCHDPRSILRKRFGKERAVDFTYHFRSLDFEFDLRTEHGLSEFTAWRHALGSYVWSVRSLTLKHWTSWWGFGVNSWTSSEDKTHFSRGTSGERVIYRALPTPAQETCKCSMEHLLAQQDAAFDLENFRAVTTILQFVNCLRTRIQ